MENILDDCQTQKNEQIDCKTRYILAENKLLSTQLQHINKLVNSYKQIVNILSKNKNDNDEEKQNSEDGSNSQVRKILKEAENNISNCVNECKQICNSKNIFPDEEGTITPAFFSQLVFSYEKTISELRHSIHHRQILLQQLETSPTHPMKRSQDLPESTAVIKAIQAYDIYPRISQKCRKEILELKQKRKEIQLKNSNPTRSSSFNAKQADKTLKKIPQYPNGSNTQKSQIPAENMSPFEKTILIYKKKKIFNDILASKVLDLKKKIKQKELCNQILRKRLQNQIWDNIENINHFGKDLEQDDPAYLSMLNQSIKANNLDFSVDISRVMPDKIAKNENVNLQNILQQVNQTERS